jgi:hypothetical protein
MTTHALHRPRPALRPCVGPALTPTQRPGLLAAAERAMRRAALSFRQLAR